MLAAASILGRNSSWIFCQSRPPGWGCQCLSRIVVHTYSKDWMLSCRCSRVSAASNGACNRRAARIAAAFRIPALGSLPLEDLGAERASDHGQRGENNE